MVAFLLCFFNFLACRFHLFSAYGPLGKLGDSRYEQDPSIEGAGKGNWGWGWGSGLQFACAIRLHLAHTAPESLGRFWKGQGWLWMRKFSEPDGQLGGWRRVRPCCTAGMNIVLAAGFTRHQPMD